MARGTNVSAGSGVAVRSPSPSAVPVPSPEETLNEIRSLLGDRRYHDAQRLAREAAVRFPDQPDVTAMNRALNEWSATTRPASGVDRSEERAWMQQAVPESLRGKVVALVGREVVASADSMAELGQQLQSMTLKKRPLVFRVA